MDEEFKIFLYDKLSLSIKWKCDKIYIYKQISDFSSKRKSIGIFYHYKVPNTYIFGHVSLFRISDDCTDVYECGVNKNDMIKIINMFERKYRIDKILTDCPYGYL